MQQLRVQRPGASGFSLAECLLAISLLLILGGLAVPGIHRLEQAWNLRAAAYLLESTLQWGRMHAVAANTSVALEVPSQGDFYYLADPATGQAFQASLHHLPGGIKIVASPQRPLRFFPKGNAAPAGTFVLRGGAGQYRVVVNVTGRIRIQKD